MSILFLEFYVEKFIRLNLFKKFILEIKIICYRYLFFKFARQLAAGFKNDKSKSWFSQFEKVTISIMNNFQKIIHQPTNIIITLIFNK